MIRDGMSDARPQCFILLYVDVLREARDADHWRCNLLQCISQWPFELPDTDRLQALWQAQNAGLRACKTEGSNIQMQAYRYD